MFREREVPTRSYNVIKDEEYCGELKLGLTFTAEVRILCNKSLTYIYHSVLSPIGLSKKYLQIIRHKK